MRAPFQLPSRNTAANRRSWPVVRPTSPAMRASGKPLSATARCTSSVLMASMPAATVSRNWARCSAVVERYGPNACAAAAHAASTCDSSP
jgi:hypothetical protein